MACGAVQGLDGGFGAVLTAHHAHIDLRHVQVGRHIQPGDGQQTALQPRVFQPSDDGDELTLHVLRQTAHIFLRHSFSSKMNLSVIASQCHLPAEERPWHSGKLSLFARLRGYFNQSRYSSILKAS